MKKFKFFIFGLFLSLLVVGCEKEPIMPIFTIEVISGIGGAATPTGIIEVPRMSNLTVTFMPDDGYEVDKILVDGNIVSVTNVYIFGEIIKNHKLEVFFKKIVNIPQYTVEVLFGTNGTISSYQSTQVVDSGSSLTIPLNPDLWHKVDYCTVNNNLVSLATDTTLSLLKISENLRIEVFFTKDLSFPWVLNGKTWDLDSMYLIRPDGIYWDYYPILGIEGERQVKMIFELDKVSIYWDEELITKQSYEITTNNPPKFKLLEWGNEATVLRLNESQFHLGITDGISEEIKGKLLYKAR